MRTKLIIIAIIVLIAIYWRGVREATKAAGYDCHYSMFSSVCISKDKTMTAPGFFEMMKAGVKF